LADTVEAAKQQIRTARTDGLKSLGGRGEEGSDDVQTMTDTNVSEVDALLVKAKKEFEKA
jgi:ribosome recycling factor